MRFVGALLFSLISLFAVGCSNTETRQFGVELKNNSSRPLTLGLVKVGYPMEKNWESPEDHAMMDPKMADPNWGVVVAPGRTVSIDKIEGEFAPNAGAFVRVYVGKHDLSEVLAIPATSRNQISVALRQGKTTLSAVDQGPFVNVVVTGYEPWGEEAKRRAETFQEKP